MTIRAQLLHVGARVLDLEKERQQAAWHVRESLDILTASRTASEDLRRHLLALQTFIGDENETV